MKKVTKRCRKVDCSEIILNVVAIDSSIQVAYGVNNCKRPGEQSMQRHESLCTPSGSLNDQTNRYNALSKPVRTEEPGTGQVQAGDKKDAQSRKHALKSNE